jgi:hypothetical protein
VPPSLQSQLKPPVANSALPPSADARSNSHWYQRSTLVAVLLFLVLNGCLLAFCKERNSTNLWNGTGSIDIAVKTFKKLKERPRVVLLGSSLMMYPFWCLDKLKDPAHVSDIFNHRRSTQLEDIYQMMGQPRPVVYSFATFGQMISDGYLYVDQFLKGDRAPEYLVFGIAPRDFHDSDLPAPMATYPFKYLVDISNFPRYADLYLPSFQEKADFVVGKICYFYGHRWHLQKEANRAIVKGYEKVGIKCDTGPAPAKDAGGFMLWGREDVRWASSKNEYKRRYSNIDTSKDVPLQMGFLQKLLELCQQRHIKVIVINMPLSDINRAQMPAGFYEKFNHQLAQVTARDGVQLIDIGSAPEFVHSDYWDTSHLNHAGGHKLLKYVVPQIVR